MSKITFLISLALFSVFNSFAQKSSNRALFEGFVNTSENNRPIHSNRSNRAYFKGFSEPNASNVKPSPPIETNEVNTIDLKRIRNLFLPYITKNILRVKELYEDLNPGLYEFSLLFTKKNADELFLGYNKEYRTRFPKHLLELHGCSIDEMKVVKRKVIEIGDISNFFKNPNQDYFEATFKGDFDFGIKSTITFFLIEVDREYTILYLKSLK